MKITKFPQSCILVEACGKKLLIDPSSIKYDESFFDIWKTADAVLVTHRHSDHIYPELLVKLNIPIYTTKEVTNYYQNISANIIEAGDTLSFGDVKVDVVRAVHGLVLPAGEIHENVGFIIDDGNKKLWVTSDTIRFKHDYKADVMFANVTPFDVSMNLWGAMITMQEVGAGLMIVAHQDAGKMIYEKDQIEKYYNSQGVNYIIPEVLEVIDI